MSALTSLASLLAVPVPAWAALFAIGGLYAVQQLTLAGRLGRHARMLGHLDRWANSVETRFEELGQGMDRAVIGPRQERARGKTPQGPRRRNDVRSLSNEQVRALIHRLVGAGAA